MGKKRLLLILITILALLVLNIAYSAENYGVCLDKSTGLCSEGIYYLNCQEPNLFFGKVDITTLTDCITGCCCFNQKTTTKTSCDYMYGQDSLSLNKFYSKSADCSQCGEIIPPCQNNFCESANDKKCWCGNSLVESGKYCCMPGSEGFDNKDSCLTLSLCNGMTETFTVAGYVKDESTLSPIKDATVYYYNLKATTLADGSYQLQKVPIGIKVISAYAPGYGIASKTASQTTPGTVNLDFFLKQSAPCTDECIISVSAVCEGTAGYKTCGNYDADSCLEYSEIISCPSNQQCVNGICQETAQPACADGQKKCQDRATKLICENSAWTTIACGKDYFCKNGDCIADNCTNNNYFCCESGTNPITAYECSFGTYCFASCGQQQILPLLNVNVKDSLGNIEGAVVSVSSLRSTTNANGIAAFNIPFAAYTIMAGKEGYSQGKIDDFNFNTNPQTATITLTKTQTFDNLHGRIIDENTNPISGASVALMGYLTKSTTTDSSGNYIFNSVTESDYDYIISASASGYVTNTKSVQVTGSNQLVSDIQLSKLQPCTAREDPDLALSIVKGKHDITTSWSAKICAVKYVLDRYKNSQLEFTKEFSSDLIYNDNSIKEPNKDYTYKLTVVYEDMTKSVSKTIKTGDLECMNGLNQFCSSGNSSSWFSGEKTFTSRCNDTNQIETFSFNIGFPANCSNYLNPTTNEKDHTCLSNGINATCIYKSKCTQCNVPLGMFSFLGESWFVNVTSGFAGNKICSEIPYCYEDSTATSVDMYNECRAISSCYNYQLEDSCTENKCLGEIECAWAKSPKFFEFGKGTCHPVETAQQNCSLCNLNNNLFDSCDSASCETYGDCYYSYAGQCTSQINITCYDYRNENDCIGGAKVSLNAVYDLTANIPYPRLAGTNKITPSKDYNSLDLCSWHYNLNTPSCFKDADNVLNSYNYLYESDCSYGDPTCKRDLTAPTTTLIPDSTMGSQFHAVVQASESAKTFACADKKSGIIREVFDLISGIQTKCYPTAQITGDLDDEITFDLSGTYLIRYYSEDIHHNVEYPIKETEFEYVGTGLELTDFESTILSNDSLLRTANLQINFSLNRQATCNATLKNLNGDVESQILNVYSDTYSTLHLGISEGRYVYYVDCVDDYGYSLNEDKEIMIDLDPDITNSKPDTAINYNQNILLSIDTLNNADCRYKEIEFLDNVPRLECDCQQYLTINCKDIVAKEIMDCGDLCCYYKEMEPFANTGLKQHTSTITKAEDAKTLRFVAGCIFNVYDINGNNILNKTKIGSTADDIIFTIDKQKPQVSALVNQYSSAYFDFSKWHKGTSFTIACKDYPILNNPGEFGCSEISFCNTTETSCTPQTVSAAASNNVLYYKTETFQQPTTVCYNGKDSGDNLKETECHNLKVDNMAPLIEDLTYTIDTQRSLATISGRVGNYFLRYSTAPTTAIPYYLADFKIRTYLNYTYDLQQNSGNNALEIIDLGIKSTGNSKLVFDADNSQIHLQGLNTQHCNFIFTNQQETELKLDYYYGTKTLNLAMDNQDCSFSNVDLAGKILFKEIPSGISSINFRDIRINEPTSVSPITKVSLSNELNNYKTTTAEIASNGEFIFENVELLGSANEPTPNPIYINATDEAENTGDPTVLILNIQDTTAPTIEITYPINGAHIEDSRTRVTGITKELDSPVSLNVTLIVTCLEEETPGRIYGGTTTSNANGEFTFSAAMLCNGANEIKTSTSDTAGNFAYDAVVVYTNLTDYEITINPVGTRKNLTIINATFGEIYEGEEKELSLSDSYITLTDLNTLNEIPLTRVCPTRITKPQQYALDSVDNCPANTLIYQTASVLDQPAEYLIQVQPVSIRNVNGLIKSEHLIVNPNAPEITPIITPSGLTTSITQTAEVEVNPEDSFVYLNVSKENNLGYIGNNIGNGRFRISFDLTSGDGDYLYNITASKNGYNSSLTYSLTLDISGPMINESGLNITKR